MIERAWTTPSEELALEDDPVKARQESDDEDGKLGDEAPQLLPRVLLQVGIVSKPTPAGERSSCSALLVAAPPRYA
jgi:hypothetical protein